MLQPGTLRLSRDTLLGVLLLCGICLYLCEYPLWHTDVWAHTKYGEWYAQHQRSPGVEPLSPYSDKSVRFPDVYWLAHVLYHGLFQLGASLAGGDEESRLFGGAEALRTFHLLLLMGRFLLLWLALRRFGDSANWATLGLFLYLLAVGIGSAVQRPQAFGLIFFTAILYALSTPSLSRRAMVWLPGMFLMWANLHGTFPAGLGMLGLHTLGRMLEKRTLDSECRRLILGCTTCFLATWVNPHGPWIYRDVLAFSGHPNLKTMTEWLPMRFELRGGNHWPYLMSLVLLGFVRILGGRKVGAAGWLVALPFAIWPWFQGRMILWWWTVAVWLLARLGPGLAERFPNLPGTQASPPTRRNAWIGGIAILAAVYALFLGLPLRDRPVVSAGTPWRLALELRAEPENEGRWIPELRRALREEFPSGQFSGAIFASETQGDFLVWYLPRETPVLMFTHAHIFPVEHWNACLNAKQAGETWRPFLAGHLANLVVVERASHAELCEEIRNDAGWRVVQDDPADGPLSVLIAVRRNPL